MKQKMFLKKAIFLDRDGVINHDLGYVHKFKDFKFKNGVIKGLKYIAKKNKPIILSTGGGTFSDIKRAYRNIIIRFDVIIPY